MRRDRRIPRGFNALFAAQTYKNLIYLALAFPTGLSYFLFLVIGLSVGFSLSFIIVGIPILIAVFSGIAALADIERGLARKLLGAKIPQRTTPPVYRKGIGGVFDRITNARYFGGLLFLGLKFPLGLMTFIIGIFAFVLPFNIIHLGTVFINVNNDLLGGIFVIFIGLIIAIASLTLSNVVAHVWRRFAEKTLDQSRTSRRIQSDADHLEMAKAKHGDDDGEKRKLSDLFDEDYAPDYFAPPDEADDDPFAASAKNRFTGH